jgi:hypothetical protein
MIKLFRDSWDAIPPKIKQRLLMMVTVLFFSALGIILYAFFFERLELLHQLIDLLTNRIHADE